MRIVKREGAHVGAYRYGEGAGPHAVTTAGAESLAYDAGIARVEEPAYATLFFQDIAPLLAANGAEAGVGAIRS